MLKTKSRQIYKTINDGEDSAKRTRSRRNDDGEKTVKTKQFRKKNEAKTLGNKKLITLTNENS